MKLGLESEIIEITMSNREMAESKFFSIAVCILDIETLYFLCLF